MSKKNFRTIPRILRIKDVSGYVVSCIFSNGEHRQIDFEHLFKNVLRLKETSVAFPLLQKPELFATLKLEGMNIIWPEVGLHSRDENGNPVFYPFELDPLMLYQNSTADEAHELAIAEMIKNMRLQAGMTQEELAQKAGTTKHYISRLENNKSDIELLTLKRIIETGFGKQLEIKVK
jgi:DNA-binding XRE family transcriptional regulator